MIDIEKMSFISLTRSAFFIGVLILFPILVSAQTELDVWPETTQDLNFSEQGEIEFVAERTACDSLWSKMSRGHTYDELSKEEQERYDNCDESFESYWDILGVGCSWYCGGGPDSISVSSHLEAQGGTDYGVENIHDLMYNTAWVEGAIGYGVGETITYHFSPVSPRVTDIFIVNGYVKSEKAWKENSRVKRLQVRYMGEVIAVLNLDDSPSEQQFDIGSLGYSNRENMDALALQPQWTLTFEILEVFKGEKYDDTVITEIYFDGLDVH